MRELVTLNDEDVADVVARLRAEYAGWEVCRWSRVRHLHWSETDCWEKRCPLAIVDAIVHVAVQGIMNLKSFV